MPNRLYPHIRGIWLPGSPTDTDVLELKEHQDATRRELIELGLIPGNAPTASPTNQAGASQPIPDATRAKLWAAYRPLVDRILAATAADKREGLLVAMVRFFNDDPNRAFQIARIHPANQV